MPSALFFPHNGLILPPVPGLDFTWSNPASGPEFPTPLSPMLPEAFSLPPLLSRNQPVPAVYVPSKGAEKGAKKGSEQGIKQERQTRSTVISTYA